VSESDSEWLAEAQKWTCHHFSVTRTEGTVPEMLRTIASKMEELGETNVLDISFARYWTQSDGESKQETTMTVYYD
jgi:hypothetical protein